MGTMHYRVFALVAWLVFFYNLERFHLIVNAQRIQLLTRFAYVFVALTALATLALPALHLLPLPLLAIGGVIGYLIIKALLGYQLWSAALPVTVTEICAFLVTILLTRQVIFAIREFNASIVNFTIRRVGRRTESFAAEQGEMYQEVRRARAFNRPLALMAVEPESDTLAVATERMVEQVQQATMRQYVLAALAKTLEEQFGPYNIIAQDGDKFLVLFPETSNDDIPQLISQVRGQVQEDLGLELRIGTATLPEVVTFDKLIETAYADMKTEADARVEGASTTRTPRIRKQLIS